MTPDFPSLTELITLAGKVPQKEFVTRFAHHYLITESVGSATASPDNLFKTREISTFKATQQRGQTGCRSCRGIKTRVFTQIREQLTHPRRMRLCRQQGG